MVAINLQVDSNEFKFSLSSRLDISHLTKLLYHRQPGHKNESDTQHRIINIQISLKNTYIHIYTLIYDKTNINQI